MSNFDRSTKTIIIFFDGVCYLCNSLVNFLIKIDTKKRLKFSPIQSEFAKRDYVTSKVNLPRVDSIIVKKADNYFIKSKAISAIIKELNWYWRVFLVMNFLPISWRDKLYDYVAKHRYKWFGLRDECMIPTEDIKSRFISD